MIVHVAIYYSLVNRVIRLNISFAGRHTIFGRVCGGITTVNRISMVETDPSDR